MVAASFEEWAGMKPLAGIVSSKDAACGKDHEDREEERAREEKPESDPPNGDSGWDRRARPTSSKIESVHKLAGGQLWSRIAPMRSFVPRGRDIGQHKLTA